VLVVADGALLASFGADADGIWSDAKIMVGLVQAAFRYLTASDQLIQPNG